MSARERKVRQARVLGVKDKQSWFEPFRMAERPDHVFYCAPHPSGRCRWWKDAANAKRGESFFERLRKSA